MSDFAYQMAIIQQAAQGDLSAIGRIYSAHTVVPQAAQPAPPPPKAAKT